MKSPQPRTTRLASIFLDEVSYNMTFGFQDPHPVQSPKLSTRSKSLEDEEVTWIWEKLLFYPVTAAKYIGRIQLFLAIGNLVLLMTSLYFSAVHGVLKLAFPITYMTSGLVMSMSAKVPSLNSVTAAFVMGIIALTTSFITILYADGPFYNSPDILGLPWLSDVIFGFLSFAFVILTILSLVQVVLGARSLCFMCHMAPIILSRQTGIQEPPKVTKQHHQKQVQIQVAPPPPHVHESSNIYHIHPHPPPAYNDEDC